MQLSEFAVIILEEDFNGYTVFPLSEKEEESWKKQKKESETREDDDRKYYDFIPGEGDIDFTTILHLAAQRNLTTIAEYYVKCYPNSQIREDEPQAGRGVPARNPIKWALLKHQDDVCSMLIKSTVNERYIFSKKFCFYVAC